MASGWPDQTMARPGLTGHRKFRRLERALGSSIVARGVLELLWDSCYEAGDDYVGTAEDIEHAVGWTGEPGMLTRALAEAGMPLGVGFIERVPNVEDVAYRVHDLWHHAPDYVSKRRKREIERQGKSDPSCPPNGAIRRRHEECQDGDVRPPSPSHSPSHSPSPNKNGSSSLLTTIEPPVLTFPTSGKPDSWDLAAAQVEEWQRLYDGLDVRAECKKALAWVKSTAGHKKTAGGMPRFLVNWLSRATNSGRGTKPSPIVPARDYVWPCPHGGTHGSQTLCRNQQLIERARGKAS